MKQCSKCGESYIPGKGCRRCAVIRVKIWRKNNPAIARQLAARCAREWRRKNPEKVSAANKRRERKIKLWRFKNAERVSAYNRKYNRSTNYRAQRAWTARHPNMARIFKAARRAREVCSSEEMKAIETLVNAVKQSRFAVCSYCQATIPTRCVEFDHIIPLSKSGKHRAENICVSCGPCNRKKSSKIPQNYVQPITQHTATE